MTWIQTRSGISLDLLDPDPKKVRIEDVAWSLSRICRFTGHVHFYSVAEHSVLASRIVPPEHALTALMHDAAEAYVGDASWPLKAAMRRLAPDGPSPYDEVERRVWCAVAERFGLPRYLPDAVKEADAALLAAERDQLMVPGEREWELRARPADVRLLRLTPFEAESEFARRFQQLGGRR